MSQDQLRAAAQALIDVHDRHHIIFPYTSAANMRGIIAKIDALRAALAAAALAKAQGDGK